MSTGTGIGVGECCLSGILFVETPKGHEENINGLDTYVSAPKDQSKSKSIVLVCDIFGYKLPNTRLFADELAKAGFFVYVPDFHEGDSIEIDFLDEVEPNLRTRNNLSTVDKGKKSAVVATKLGTWLPKHTEGKVWPLVEGFIKHVKSSSGTDKVGTVGFCWGGRYSILAAHGHVDAAVAYHPSLVTVPGDFDPVTKPLSLACGDQDSLLPKEEVGKIKDCLSKKTDVQTEVKLYADQIHGFALRGDWSYNVDKKAMDDALRQGIDWLKRYLA